MKHEKYGWRQGNEGWLGGTENPIETEDHKCVVAIIYGF